MIFGFKDNKCKGKVYTQEEVDNLVAKYKVKGDFATITGTATFDENGTTTVNYPSGFTKTNCVVISFMTEGIGQTKSLSTGSTFDSSNTISGSVPKAIKLADDNIVLAIRHISIINDATPSISSTYPNMNYKIVLMKI